MMAADLRTTEDTRTDEDDLLVAATLIKDADASRYIHFRNEPNRIRSYLIYNHVALKATLFLCIWINLLLALAEKPAVGTMAMPYWATMTVEAMCLLFFAMRLAHGCHFQQPTHFWRDPNNLTFLITIILTVIDMICYNIWLNVGSLETRHLAIRWSRPLRPLFLINIPESRQLRKAIRSIRRTLPDILHILILFLANTALFALLCLKLFEDRHLSYPDGKPYFQNYLDSFWDLYVLVTTANNPDVMMPAYDVSKWYVTVFIVYLLVNLYVFMNIVLAVIYNNYKRHLKDEVKLSIKHKHHLLGQAFDLLKTNVGGRNVITKQTFHDVITMVDKSKTSSQIDLLFKVLNRTMDDYIVKQDFTKLADLLAIRLHVEKEDGSLFDRKCPPCYRSKVNQTIIMIIRTRYFRWVFDALIVCNAVCIGLRIDSAEWYFLLAFTVEIVAQLYARGPGRYFKTFWNSFDFLVISSALIATSVGSVVNKETTKLHILDLIMVLRILRLVRLANINGRFRIVLTTIVNIGPSIVTYGCIILMVFYVYAIVGMELFHSRINYYGYDNLTNSSQQFCGNPALNGSKFAENRYCSNNFNSLPHSLVFLFHLLMVNQWHVLAEGYVLVTQKAARIYFISFHMFNVIILLNIFTAFIIETFILEYTSSKGKLESVVERRIKELGLGIGQTNDRHIYKKQDKQELVENIEIEVVTASTGDRPTDGKDVTSDGRPKSHDVTESQLKFRLKTSGCKRLEELLQLMFENELDLDLDPEEIKRRTSNIEHMLTDETT